MRHFVRLISRFNLRPLAFRDMDIGHKVPTPGYQSGVRRILDGQRMSHKSQGSAYYQ